MAEDKALGKSVNFTVEEGTAEDGKSSGERRIAKRSTERSSFFQKLSRSFKRSGGERGANVDTIRGTHGADFEGTGIIARAGAGVGCGCMGGGEDTKTKLMLIKGVHCFVYKDENAPSPKYTIPLAHLRAKKRNPSMGLTMVQLQSNLGDVEYEVSFSDEDVAKEFESAVNKQATVAETQEVRKRLGHQGLLKQTKSEMFADNVGQKKTGDQPEKQERLTAKDLAVLNPVGL